MADTEFLGQDLLRSALEDGQLDVFEAPAAVMRDTAESDYARADAFKALRHGLAGISIYGWQRSILEPLDTPVPTDEPQPICYRFKPGDHFPPHDSTIYDEGPKDCPATVIQNQGEFALTTLNDGLISSFDSYIDPASRQVFHGISIEETYDKLTAYLREGKNLGLFEVPDVFDGYEFLWEGFKTVAAPSDFDIQQVKNGVASSARNAVRFSRLPIEDLMKTHQDKPDVDQLVLRGMMRRIMRHNTRVSQGHSFNGRTLAKQARMPNKLTIETNTAGRPEITWPDKNKRPIPYHQRGASFEEDSFEEGQQVNITKRNKCPAGYTAKAKEPMGLQLASDAIITYLAQNSLDVPAHFTAPKQVYYDAFL